MEGSSHKHFYCPWVLLVERTSEPLIFVRPAFYLANDAV